MSIYISAQEALGSFDIINRIKNTVQHILDDSLADQNKHVLAIAGYDKQKAAIHIVWQYKTGGPAQFDTLFLENVIHNSRNMDRNQLLELFLEMEP